MHEEALLRAILSMTARQAFSEEKVLQIVAPKSPGETQIAAYNLCDGTRLQGEIAKELKLDPSNFSKTVARWVEAGIVVRLGDKSESKPLHIYPIPKERTK